MEDLEGGGELFSSSAFLKVHVFIFGCAGSPSLSAGFLYLQRAGVALCGRERASPCGGPSCCRAWALGVRISVVTADGLSICGSRALEHRLSSCGAQDSLLCSMWDLPGPRIEPMPPALAGESLITGPPGKPLIFFFLLCAHIVLKFYFFDKLISQLIFKVHLFFLMLRHCMVSSSPHLREIGKHLVSFHKVERTEAPGGEFSGLVKAGPELMLLITNK